MIIVLPNKFLPLSRNEGSLHVATQASLGSTVYLAYLPRAFVNLSLATQASNMYLGQVILS